MHSSIYSIYGFVRLADEIVDSFHEYDKKSLMRDFRNDTVDAMQNGISLNPILNSFQQTVTKFNIDWDCIDTFLKSMEMDLEQTQHTQQSYEQYIVGSAEVVGLMCLRVFTEGDTKNYELLKPFAMKLGAAFQKVNFLRDLKMDYVNLGRTYFPNIDFENFTEAEKKQIDFDIQKDFEQGLLGIKGLPDSSKLGVYLAYYYYFKLFKKIIDTPAKKILQSRIRISNPIKIWLILKAFIRVKTNRL